jgi:hypothetical protein
MWMMVWLSALAFMGFGVLSWVCVWSFMVLVWVCVLGVCPLLPLAPNAGGEPRPEAGAKRKL